MHSFEKVLQVSQEDIEFTLAGLGEISWLAHHLNPRRLRGSDFLMRWSQGAWSEDRVVEALNSTGKFYALPYGPSGTAPDDDVKAFELYFERLDAAGLANIKRPDLLIYRAQDRKDVEAIVAQLQGEKELPFTPEDNPQMKKLLAKAIIAVECENSLWRSKKMPGYGVALTPQKRLGGKPGLKKTVVVPTVIMKEEDRGPLKQWQQQSGVKIHIWHVFYDLAFGLSLDRAEKLVQDGLILPSTQVFQAPGGATTSKDIYKFYYLYAYELGHSIEEPKLLADHIEDKNGHILPFVRFNGGKLKIADSALKVLEELAGAKK